MPFHFPFCLSRRSLRTLTVVSAPLGVLAVGLAGCPSSTTTTTYVPITGIVIRASSLVAGLGCGTGPGQVYRYAAVVRHADDPSGPVVSDATVVEGPLADATIADATIGDDAIADDTLVDAVASDGAPAAAPPATDAAFVDAAGTNAGGGPTDAAQTTVANDPDAGVWVNVFDCFTDGVFENLPPSAANGLAFTVSIFAYDKAAYDATMLPASLGCPPAAAGQFTGCGVATPVDESAATWTTICSATQQSGTPVLAVCPPLERTSSSGAGDGSWPDDGATGPAADGSASDTGPGTDADAGVLDAGPGTPDASDAAGTSPGDAAAPDARAGSGG